MEPWPGALGLPVAFGLQKPLAYKARELSNLGWQQVGVQLDISLHREEPPRCTVLVLGGKGVHAPDPIVPGPPATLPTFSSRTLSSASSFRPFCSGLSRPCCHPLSTTPPCWSPTGPSECWDPSTEQNVPQPTTQGRWAPGWGLGTLRVVTSGFLQVGGEPDHGDQGVYLFDLHGADPAIPRPHQVHGTASPIWDSGLCLDSGNGFGVN